MQRFFIITAILTGFCASAFAGPDLTSARIYRNQGDYGKAIEFFTKEIEKDPESWVGIFERGEVYGMTAMDRTKKGVMRDLVGEPEDAQYEVLKLMMKDFDMVDASDEKQARKYHKNIDEILDGYWAKFYNQAVGADTLHERAMEAGDSTKAAEALATMLQASEKALLMKPGDWNTLALKGQTLDRAGMIEEANEIWQRAKVGLEADEQAKKSSEEFFNSWIVIQLHRLQNYYNIDKYDMCVTVADEILEHCTDEGYDWRSLADGSTDGETEGSSAGEDVKEFPGHCKNALSFKAYSLTQMAGAEGVADEERPLLREKAVAALDAASKVDPEDSSLMFYLGQFSLQDGDTAKAIDWYRQYTGADTSDTDVLFLVGYIYLEGGTFVDYAKAEATFQSIVERDPNSCNAWINLGVSQIKQDKTKVGAENVKKGKECNGESSGE